nr:hypothetical protein [Tanacetum cinerariifolium]
MEAAVEQCSVDEKHFEIQKKEIFLDNNRLLEHIIGQGVIFIVMHANIESKCVLPENENRIPYAELEQSYLTEYSKNLKLKVELSKREDVIGKEVYHRITKVAKSVDLRSEPSILGFRASNILKPNKHWGSDVSNSPSSSLVDFRLSKLFTGTVKFGNDQIAKIMGYRDYHMVNVTISQIKVSEGSLVFHLCTWKKQETLPQTKILRRHSKKALSSAHGPLRTNEDSKYQCAEIHIGDEYHNNGYLTEKEKQQLLLDEEVLRETLEEEAKAEKELT